MFMSQLWRYDTEAKLVVGPNVRLRLRPGNARVYLSLLGSKVSLFTVSPGGEVTTHNNDCTYCLFSIEQNVTEKIFRVKHGTSLAFQVKADVKAIRCC